MGTFKVSQNVKLEHMVSFDEGQPRAGLSEAEAKQKAKQRNGKWHEDATEEDEENKARKEARKDEAVAEIQGLLEDKNKKKKKKVEERGLEYRGDEDRKEEKNVEKGKKGTTHQDRIQPGKIEK